MKTTLTGKNQVTVPAELAREMGLEPGSRLDWKKGKAAGTLVVTVQPSVRQMLDRAQEIGSKWKNRNLIEELIKEREQEML